MEFENSSFPCWPEYKDEVEDNLVKISVTNPWRRFDSKELQAITGYNQYVVSAVLNHEGTPFRCGKCSPKAFVDFLDGHPEVKERRATDKKT